MSGAEQFRALIGSLQKYLATYKLCEILFHVNLSKRLFITHKASYLQSTFSMFDTRKREETFLAATQEQIIQSATSDPIKLGVEHELRDV